ncbi:hypothetical protein [Aquimarina brevivitae]|uniref:hypothetical protein n=1 Tax=Aquimarina brevivitae TaxID=323412 RepID=UPI00102898FD|nr:hypothetical protein [Aquimarina brevivitae]
MSNCIRYISFCFFYFTIIVSAQQKEDTKVVIDSTTIQTIEFSKDLNDKYNGSEFDYTQDIVESRNLLARFINWVSNGIADMLGIKIDPAILKVIETIIYIILIGFAIYLVIRILAGKDAISFFKRKNTSVNLPIHIAEEDIEKINLEDLISEALANQNYRLAIRYMYLKVLQNLSASAIVEYHFEKTNTDYFQEIANPSIKQGFSRVSYLYDYIWYGKFELDQGGFDKAKRTFDNLNSLIK